MKKKLFMSLSVLIIGFLLCTSSLNTLSKQALLVENHNQYITDSFDRFTWKWNTTEVVSTESTDLIFHHSLTVDNAGNVHIVWSDWTDYSGAGIDEDIFYKRWDSSTSSWTSAEVVSTESTADSRLPSIAVDSVGNIHIAWFDFTNYASSGADVDIFYKRWDSSTSSWTTTEVVSIESTATSQTPSLAVDSAGTVHVTWTDATDYAGSGTDVDIFYKRWDSSTSSWTSAEVVSTESTDDSWYTSLAVDSTGSIHVAWIDFTDYAGAGTDQDIFYKSYVASTSSWTTTEVVSTESTDDSLYPSLAVDSAGTIHIAWWDRTNYTASGTDRDIFYKRKDAASSTWTTSEVVSTESTNESLKTSLAVDSAGTVHIAWEDTTDYAGSGTDSDIFYKRKDATSSTWTTAEVVSTESTADSEWPSLAVDSAGTVHIAWEDTTDYAGSGADPDIFYKLLAGSPTAPELAFIVPNPTELPTINLDWNNVLGATTYYVYRSTSYIWSVEGLAPITTTSSSAYIDTLPSEGYYYYVIVAENFVGNSSHSNCQYVEYELPHVREFGIISGLIFGAFVVSLVIMKTRKNKLKRTS